MHNLFKHHRPFPKAQGRRSIRLKGYDYSQPGAYYITLCLHDREWLFGKIVGGEMALNANGECVAQTWYDLPNHNSNIILDAFVIMPNHIHGIIIITYDEPAGAVGAGSTSDGAYSVGAGSEPAPTEPTDMRINTVVPAPTAKKRQPLSEIVRQLKTFSAKRINALRRTPGVPVWQRNYYEHIVRNDFDLKRIRQYIIDNPKKWNEDEYFA